MTACLGLLIGIIAGRWLFLGGASQGDPQRAADEGRLVIARKDFQSSLPDLLKNAPENTILRAPQGHTPGHIIFGPYWKLAAGDYHAEMVLQFGPEAKVGEQLCTMDVYDGVRFLDVKPVYAEKPGQAQREVISFFVPWAATDRRHEFRLWCDGKASVTVVEAAFLH